MPQSDYDDEINDLDSDGEAVPRGELYTINACEWTDNDAYSCGRLLLYS